MCKWLANLFSQTLLLVAGAFVVGFVQPLVHLFLLLGSPSKEHVVYEGIFEQGQEHKDKAAHEVDVDGFHIGDLWEGLPQVGVDGCHSEHRSYTCKEAKLSISHVHTITSKLVGHTGPETNQLVTPA